MNFRPLQVLAPLALTAFVGAAAFVPTTVHAKPAASKAKIAWQPTFEQGLALAKRTNKPLMVDFFATWCGPCKLLDSHIYSNAKVVTESRNWINVKVDGEKRADLMKKYDLSAFPSIVFFAPNGKVLKKQIGLSVPPDKQNSMDASIAYIVDDMTKTLKTLRARAKGATTTRSA